MKATAIFTITARAAAEVGTQPQWPETMTEGRRGLGAFHCAELLGECRKSCSSATKIYKSTGDARSFQSGMP